MVVAAINGSGLHTSRSSSFHDSNMAEMVNLSEFGSDQSKKDLIKRIEKSISNMEKNDNFKRATT